MTTLDEEGLPTGEPVPDPGPDGPEPVSEAPVAKRRGLVVLCIGLGIAAAGFAVLAAVSTATLERERTDRERVEEASGRFASALLTYDYQDLDTAKRRVLELSTGKFRREYEQAFSGGLDVLFQQTQARSTGTVTELFVGPMEDGSVTTVVVVDAVAQGSAGGRRQVNSYIQLELVKVDGQWKVDGVTYLNTGGPAETGTTTTTTTAAPK